ncbi:MAG: type II toxin-antitoxin system VapC family toxin, partial [Caulobacter sp.]
MGCAVADGHSGDRQRMTIVVDASALVAMARREPEAEAMERVLDGVQGWATPVNIMEAGLILVLRESRFNQSQF